MFSKSVDSVMRVFNKTIADLQKVKDREEEKSDHYNETADEFIMLANEAAVEAQRAGKLIKKLEAFVNE